MTDSLTGGTLRPSSIETGSIETGSTQTGSTQTGSTQTGPLEKKGAHPAFWVPTLYLAEGVPFVATMTVSVFMYKSLGLKDAEIAAYTSLLAWPWTLKPLWSPLMELYATKRHFVLATQFLGGLCFALMALSLSTERYIGLSLAMFALIAFNSATHDIAADGLYIESLSSERQARFVGWQGAFWNSGKFLAQGGLVWIAGELELTLGPRAAWGIVLGLFAGVLVVLSVYHARVLPSGRRAEGGKPASAVLEEFWQVVRSFFTKRHVFWGLAFILLYRFAEGQAQKIFPLFLRADRAAGGLGLSTADAALAYGTVGAAAFIIGSIAGGYFAAHLKLRRALMTLCAAFNLPYLAYVLLAFLQPKSLYLVGSAVAVEMFGYGFGFVGVTLFMMQQMATGKYKMAHYSFATATMNFGLMLPGFFSGFLSDAVGYRAFFVWVMVSTLLSFTIARLVPFKTEAELEAENAAPEGARA